MTDEERDQAIAALQAQVAEITRRMDRREDFAAGIQRVLRIGETDDAATARRAARTAELAQLHANIEKLQASLDQPLDPQAAKRRAETERTLRQLEKTRKRNRYRRPRP